MGFALHHSALTVLVPTEPIQSLTGLLGSFPVLLPPAATPISCLVINLIPVVFQIVICRNFIINISLLFGGFTLVVTKYLFHCFFPEKPWPPALQPMSDEGV